ncbi:uncharacterized protein F4817DRAFT_130087 [Daldinia loculata]|uniref:uncharacterized protein n=1 Tax=Daldinia loculata TaxID=103429 RepID=UPI0020C36D1C|nr:uncharacterized protein F4817DRAFT_130087 [Daldinia loculata]KAI1651397.1 hypothetical protein F4817DRAFT_130087 [Daldinia loculata]
MPCSRLLRLPYPALPLLVVRRAAAWPPSTTLQQRVTRQRSETASSPPLVRLYNQPDQSLKIIISVEIDYLYSTARVTFPCVTLYYEPLLRLLIVIDYVTV